MSESRTFVIRRSFLLPLGLLLLLSLLLLAVCLIQGQPAGKIIILSCIILPVGVLFVESAFRRVVVGPTQVTAFKLLRQKAIPFAAITALETVQVRKRAFLTLCADEEFLILSNAYADFPALVRMLLEKAPAAAVSEETRKMAAAPPVKTADVVSCWLAVALLALILYIQLGGKF